MQHSKPTIIDVARVAGVSRSAASRAVNGQPGVNPEVRDRVLRAVRGLGYRPDRAARALASGRRDVLYLVVVDEDPHAFANKPYHARVAAGILTTLAGTDAQLSLHVVPERHADRLLDDVAAANGLGTVLVNVAAPLAERFYRRCSRVVSMGRFADPVPFSEAENGVGATTAVRHLFAGGRRRIAAINGPRSNPCARDRHRGYLEAMAAIGERPMWTDGDFSRPGGYGATLRLLADEPELDAIVAACDCTAAAALQALAATGRRVPDDVAVVGFDDSELAACTTPALTSVRQPVEAMAARAARALLESQVDSGWHDTFPTSLSVRAST